MKRLTAGLMAILLSCSANLAPCEDHLVSPQLVDVRLREAREHRALDIVALRTFLSGPLAVRAAATVHLDREVVAESLSVLSDAELRDLADRARRLDSDPRAGMSGAGKAVLITLAVAAAVFLILLIYLATCDCLFGD